MKKKIKKSPSKPRKTAPDPGNGEAEKLTRPKLREKKLARKVEAHTLHERGVLPGEEDPERTHPF